jgi:hypothetical protein
MKITTINLSSFRISGNGPNLHSIAVSFFEYILSKTKLYLNISSSEHLFLLEKLIVKKKLSYSATN